MRAERMRRHGVDVVLAHRELHGRRGLRWAPDLDESVAAGRDDFLRERIDLEVPDKSVVTPDLPQCVACIVACIVACVIGVLAIPQVERVARREGDGGLAERGDALDGALDVLLRVDEEGGQRIAVDVFEERDEPHGMRRVGERLRDLVAVGLLEKRDETVGRDLWEKEEGERERAFRGSRSRRRTRARAWRRGFPGISGCPASARSRGSYERSEGQRGSRGKTLRERR